MWYRNFLEDDYRYEQIYKAVSKIVKPGDIVIDIGSGMGTLSLFASKAGAKKVYAIEAGEAIIVSQEIAKANKLNNIEFIRTHSSKLELDVKADVIMTEVIGPLGFGGEITRSINDIKKRLLKSDGKIIPEKLSVFMVPVYDPELYQNIFCWDKNVYGVDFSAGKKLAVNVIHEVEVSNKQLVMTPSFEYNFYTKDDENLSFTQEFSVDSRQTLYGYLGWYEYHLVDGIKLTNQPGAKDCWGGQSFFPLQEPLEMDISDKIRTEVKGFFLGGRFYWNWATTLLDKNQNIIINYSQNNIDELYAQKLLKQPINQ